MPPSLYHFSSRQSSSRPVRPSPPGQRHTGGAATVRQGAQRAQLSSWVQPVASGGQGWVGLMTV